MRKLLEEKGPNQAAKNLPYNLINEVCNLLKESLIDYFTCRFEIENERNRKGSLWKETRNWRTQTQFQNYQVQWGRKWQKTLVWRNVKTKRYNNFIRKNN